MRITYDHEIFSWQRHGGISRYFTELAKHLSSRPNVEVKIIAPFHVNKYLHELDGSLYTGVPIPWLPRTGRIVSLLNRMPARYCARRFNPDIHHETYFFSVPHGGKHTKTVITIHDMAHERLAGFFPANDRTRPAKRRAIARADHIICVSENTKKDLLDITGVDPARVSVVYHGCTLVAPTDTAIHEQGGAPYILFVGDRSGYKNFRRLVTAFADCPELKHDFRLVCFGGGSFSHDENRLLVNLGLGRDRISQLGGNDRILASYFQQAAVFVYPSLYEGFGLPLLEAMSHGCPVACSDRGSIPEIAGEAAVYFDPTDENDISNAILKIVGDPSRSELLNKLGRQRLERFTWRKPLNRP